MIFIYSTSLKHNLKFSHVRAICKYLKHRDYTLYIKNSQKAIKTNTILFWKFTNQNNIVN